MNWNLCYRVRHYIKSSLWVIPIAAVVVELIVATFIHTLDARLGWNGMGFGLEGARVVGSTVITLSLSFIVFTFGSLLVAIQIASGQYTPRIIATTLLRDNVIRYTVGLFVFTLFFAIKAMNHMESTVPQLVIFITAMLGIICLAVFLYLIDYSARMLRPVSLVKRVGEAGICVIKSVFPEKLAPGQNSGATAQSTSPVERTVLHQGTSAIILAVDIQRLIAEAEKANDVIELAPHVGDFVGADEPLFRLRGNAASIDDQTLRNCIIFGAERTMEQDPMFAFRILVDIAIKALSAAINDPTTAVLSIDQLHRLLRSAGLRNLDTGYRLNRDGKLRVILRTPDWDDFVHMAFTEIRFCGASNIQIARRLRAMIVNLTNTLPIERQTALQQELSLLDRMLEKLYFLPEDLALARIPDSQGLGGSTDTTAPRRND